MLLNSKKGKTEPSMMVRIVTYAKFALAAGFIICLSEFSFLSNCILFARLKTHFVHRKSHLNLGSPPYFAKSLSAYERKRPELVSKAIWICWILRERLSLKLFCIRVHRRNPAFNLNVMIPPLEQATINTLPRQWIIWNLRLYGSFMKRNM